jgi:hypothetical protein
MERRVRFRWTHDTGRLVAGWFRHLAAVLWKCRRVTYADPETDERAVRIGTACPDCVCEAVSVGRHGSPGRIRNHENLRSVLIAPGDLQNDQIAITLITHAERKGVSVLRGGASDDEFRRIIQSRIRDARRQRFHGIASVPCARIRTLVAENDGVQRRAGDRLYSVLDSDMPGLPNHADVFATVPRPHERNGPKAAWRTEREKLLNLFLEHFADPQTSVLESYDTSASTDCLLPFVKAKAEKLAKLEQRSLSSWLELVVEQAIETAEAAEKPKRR